VIPKVNRSNYSNSTIDDLGVEKMNPVISHGNGVPFVAGAIGIRGQGRTSRAARGRRQNIEHHIF
jgi:hypothetical protein